MFRPFQSTFILSSLIAALPTAALAQHTTLQSTDPAGTEVRSEAVPYHDLDLGNSDGAATLLGRIRSAAKDVCAPEPPHASDLAAGGAYRACVQQAADQAVAGMNNQTVTYAYQRRREPR